MAKKVNLPASPIEVMFTITNDAAVNEVNKILNEFKDSECIALYAKGTVKSEIVDLFGFGILERMLTITIISTKNRRELLERISTDLKFNTEEGRGLVFTVPINSIEKQALNLLNIKVDK